MARPLKLPTVDLRSIGHAPEALETAVVYLRTGGRPARACSLEDHAAAMARQAELDAHAQADLLGEVITAVFDRLDLSTAARATANELLKAELLEAAVRWEARAPQWPG